MKKITLLLPVLLASMMLVWGMILITIAEVEIRPLKSEFTGERHFSVRLSNRGRLGLFLAIQYETKGLRPTVLPTVVVTIFGKVVDSPTFTFNRHSFSKPAALWPVFGPREVPGGRAFSPGGQPRWLESASSFL